MSDSFLKETQRLLQVVHDLRTKCPWDRKQTHRSLLPYLLEESYEAIEAIQKGNREQMREELGDLLLQIALHAELSREKGDFTFEDVARGIADKMIRRHPHVYGETELSDARTHEANWARLKRKENPNRSLLEGTPRSMPGLALSQRYGESAAAVGFDWDGAAAVLEKVEEELGELKREIKRRRRNKRAVAEELGDVFFALANLARHLELNAEETAKGGARKFATRFRHMETQLRRAGQDPAKLSADQWESYWARAKRAGRKAGGSSRRKPAGSR